MRLIDANYLRNKFIPNCPIEEGGIPLGDFNAHQKILALYPTVDAVEVSRLGKLGRLMMPYKGCPRGRIGAYGAVGGNTTVTEIHITELDAIVDVEGDRWIPVLAEDLEKLKARANNTVEVVHGHVLPAEEPKKVLLDMKCAICDQLMLSIDAYCPMCGAKMNGDGDG